MAENKHFGIITDSEFKWVLQSSIAVNDNKDKFRSLLVQYINDVSDNNDDMFFYEMLPFVRFNPSDKNSIAYTTPDKLIFMNSPCQEIGESHKNWYFIYAHECLHQLWDTFGVADKIKSAKGDVDHQLLNIASDCVINDYLNYYRKLEFPPVGITPEVIKEKYGIDYNRKEDTQFSLYMKMVENLSDKDKEDLKNQYGDSGEQQSEQGQSSQSNGQGQQGDGQQGNKGDGKGDKGDGKGQGSQQGDKGNGKGNKGDGQQGDGQQGDGQQGDGQNGQQGDKGNGQQGDKGNGKGNKGDGQQGDGQSGQQGDGHGKKAGSGASPDIDTSKEYEDLKRIRNEIDGILKKYQNKLSGKLGEFVSKCKQSQKCQNPIKMKSDNGNNNWNKKMTERIRNYVKNMVFKKKRLYERTFSRIKRGTIPRAGQPIMAGKKILENAFDISLAFYIDCSGSMEGILDNALKSVYSITEEIKKTYSRDKMISSTDFLMHAFNERIKPFEYGKKLKADGTTCTLTDLFEFIEKNTNDVYINTVITDGEFRTIDVNKLKSYIKQFDGIFIFIVNNSSNEKLKELEVSLPGKFFYIPADSNFTI